MNWKKYPDQDKGKRTLYDLEGLSSQQSAILRYNLHDQIVETLEVIHAYDFETWLDVVVSETVRSDLDPLPIFSHPEINEVKTYSDYYKEIS